MLQLIKAKSLFCNLILIKLGKLRFFEPYKQYTRSVKNGKIKR